MAGTNGSLHQTHIPSQTLDRLFTALDPKSLILSHFQSNQEKPNFLQLTTESFVMERGPRYKAYSDLRESKLRMKQARNQSTEKEPSLSPPKKQAKQGIFPRKTGSSVLAQSVPDFAAVVRKENRKPPPGMMPVMMEKKSLTPPAKNSRKVLYGAGAGSGSKSVNSGEKRSGGIMTGRKSYACMEELKGFSVAAAYAINGENRGGRSGRGRGVGKTVLGYRQY
ncbi:hypothetical protein RHGRI_028768 [Rhododendron griersonianum]|uniref:Uncharacterized protein n=1 Tax=Rhododendron griersonianum TaxID=479676 RepID=A0AAV6IHG9_9ERIC|nr:hypothetical protein RHGRI_028768 [Rhododendron griersonianum]